MHKQPQGESKALSQPRKVTIDANDLRAVLDLAQAALGAGMVDVRDLDAMDRVTDALNCVRRKGALPATVRTGE
jgi:hypothetical protein